MKYLQCLSIIFLTYLNIQSNGFFRLDFLAVFEKFHIIQTDQSLFGSDLLLHQLYITV